MKRIFIITLLCFYLISSCVISVCAQTDKSAVEVAGDVDSDGDVNIIDVTVIQQYCANNLQLTSSELRRADVTCDNVVNVLDATTIQRFLANLSYDGTVNIEISSTSSEQPTPEIVYETKPNGFWQIINDTKIIEVENIGCSGIRTNLINAEEGDRFRYNGRGQYAVPSVVWFDSNKKFLKMEQYIGETIFTAPANCAYAQFYTFDYGLNSVLEVSHVSQDNNKSVLYGKKIVYDGDSICESRIYSQDSVLANYNNGGAYAKIIADITGGTYANFAKSGASLRAKQEDDTFHSLVDNLENLPKDGDLYCFEGGINDYWRQAQLGTYSDNYNDDLDTSTVCGALEYIFRYSLENFKGKPIVFVITHKIQHTAYVPNAQGNTFKDYHDVMVGICEKYSIPYYDAFLKSGLNGWNSTQNDMFLTSNESAKGDGCHPNEEGYRRYYVPQLISIFENVMPVL